MEEKDLSGNNKGVVWVIIATTIFVFGFYYYVVSNKNVEESTAPINGSAVIQEESEEDLVVPSGMSEIEKELLRDQTESGEFEKIDKEKRREIYCKFKRNETVS